MARSINAETRANDQILIAYDGSDNIEYVGNAKPGAATSESVWRIKKLTYSGSNVLTLQWAGGSPAYTAIWDSRASLVYS